MKAFTTTGHGYLAALVNEVGVSEAFNPDLPPNPPVRKKNGKPFGIQGLRIRLSLKKSLMTWGLSQRE